MLPISAADVRAAAARIAGAIEHTPCVHSRTLSQLTGAEVFLKFENLQFTASFKERGALNKLLSLCAAERRRGVIAMSAGNHAQAVAYHAARLGIPATDRDAEGLAEHQDPQHPGARRDGGARGRQPVRGRQARARARRARRPGLRASLRRPADHRRPGHRRRSRCSRRCPTSRCWWCRSAAAA